jgi:hypothetical protein
MPRIEVALVGPTLGPSDWWDLDVDRWERATSDENARSWNERRRVTLDVEPDETLEHIFGRVIAETGTWEADWNTYVHSDSAPEPGPRTRRFLALREDASRIPLQERLSKALTLVDADGRAIWSAWHYDVTYQQLKEAADAGAVPGDPQQIYLAVRSDPAGGGILNSWELLLQAWDEGLEIVAGMVASGLYSKVKRRFAGRRVLGPRIADLLNRGGHADYVRHALRGEDWSPRDLAGLLGCTVSEAEDVLALYGYEPRADGEMWEYAGGNEALGLPPTEISAQVVARYTDEVLRRYADMEKAPPEELHALFKEILRQTSERGEIDGLEHVSSTWH